MHIVMDRYASQTRIKECIELPCDSADVILSSDNKN